MKLYEYLNLMPEGEELTVWDIDYDMEVYFYGGKPADTWSKAGEKENPKVAEILYNSVSKETLDKYRNLSIPTSKEKSELKKSFKSNVTDVINEIISYIKSSGYDMVTPRNPYTNVSNFTMLSNNIAIADINGY